MITFSLQLGIGLIAIAGILGFLFVYSKSPVRRRWWSISNKLGVKVLGNVRVNNSSIEIEVGYVAVPSVQVDAIKLRIRRQPLECDWECQTIEATGRLYVKCPRPSWLRKGQYEACLIAYTPDGFSKSKKFSIRVDE